MEDKKPYSFINETVKERPLNKRKLFRKTALSVFTAVIFGGVACLTFLLLEPVISNLISPEEIVKVEFPEDHEEIAPEEMLTEENIAYENQLEEQQISQQINQQVNQQLQEGVADGQLALKTYQVIYDQLYQISTEASYSMVLVEGMSQETDWFQNQVENVNETSGVIVAKNEAQVYIVADLNSLPDANSYTVTFYDGTVRKASIQGSDPNTGMAVFTVPASSFEREHWDKLRVMELGNSNAMNVVGRPVVAVGSPLGQSGSICYGIVTSNQQFVTYADHHYRILTTDMTGSSKNASGVLINTSGELLGFITKEAAANATASLITGFGVSDVKNLVEELSNEDKRLYLGIHSAAVTEEIHTELGIPYGMYVTEVDSGSPAMTCGITNGDVIVEIGSTMTNSRSDYETALQSLREDMTVVVKIKRFNGEAYIDIEGEIRPEELR